jgi:formate dehydrogenase subunit beta
MSMIEAIVDVQDSMHETIQGLLRTLFDRDVIDALLVPVVQPGGKNVSPTLVTDPDQLQGADPLAPVLPINAARAVSNLTKTGHTERLGVVLRSCEIRALVELIKLLQAQREALIIVGIDCLGTYELADLGGRMGEATAALLAGAESGELRPADGLELRAACTSCHQFTPEGEHVDVALGFLGLDPTRQLLVRASTELAQALDLNPGAASPTRQPVVDRLRAQRLAARDEAFADVRSRLRAHGLDGFLEEFATCIRCHNCMVNCPICYCKECIFRTPTFDHASERYFLWAKRKGSVRLLSDTLLFQLTRLNHMATSCVGCGLCTSACPSDIPVGTIFQALGARVQALFDYQPGRSLDEPAPVQEFREDELTALGERPRQG